MREYLSIKFKEIQGNEEVKTYIKSGNDFLGIVGLTEHGFAHAERCAVIAEEILKTLGFDSRTCELAAISGYMHDIGNVVNRVDHAQSGALMAFDILRNLGMSPEEVALVVSAIGNHDEGTAEPISPIAAALILADKSDVRRTRVRNKKTVKKDMHDRVNYAVEESSLNIDKENKKAVLNIKIDTSICPVMEYFEIFLSRMILCRKAAKFLCLSFELVINGVRLL